MKLPYLLLALLPLAAAPARPAPAKLKVVTTILDLADITSEIGGERVDVTSITKGKENIHAVQVRPSALVAFSRADVFVQVGLSLEHSWVPGLLMASRNEKIQAGAPGFVSVSEGWQPIQVPETLSRQFGADLHPQGNPHINLDPKAGRHMAERILAGLVRVEPQSKAYFEARHADYVRRLDAAEARWREAGAALKGRKIAVYHRNFDYFAAASGIEIVATIEPKPGIPPTPGHIAEVIRIMREQRVGAIVTAAWSNNKHTAEIAERTGARVLEVPVMVGGAKGADTWIAMIEALHTELAEALGAPARTD